jgi:8-oxo-dGTP diphosphatase
MQNIKIAVDNAIFTIIDQKLNVLLIEMKEKFEGSWALPGGLLENDETLDDAAARYLSMQTNIQNIFLEQLYTFSDPNRDSLQRVVSTAYYALIPSDRQAIQTSSKYKSVRWCPIDELPSLAYDHTQIIATALERLRSKISYSNIVWSLLPQEFTFAQLQNVYEIILNKELDRRNFRRKYLSLDLIRELAKKSSGDAHRPAQLYTFTTTEPNDIPLF